MNDEWMPKSSERVGGIKIFYAMKNLFLMIIFSLLIIPFAEAKKPQLYASITGIKVEGPCYDVLVSIYSDNGTPNNPRDDIYLGQGYVFICYDLSGFLLPNNNNPFSQYPVDKPFEKVKVDITPMVINPEQTKEVSIDLKKYKFDIIQIYNVDLSSTTLKVYQNISGIIKYQISADFPKGAYVVYGYSETDNIVCRQFFIIQ